MCNISGRLYLRMRKLASCLHAAALLSAAQLAMKHRIASALLSVLCTVHVIVTVDAQLECSGSILASVQVNGSRGNTIYRGEGVVASGCFTSMDTTLANVTVRILHNSSAVAEGALDSMTGCFELRFSLQEAGNHTLSLTASEGDNATTTCNGSVSLLVEVQPCVLSSLPVTARLLYLTDVSHAHCLLDACIGSVIRGSLGEGMVTVRPQYGGALVTMFDAFESRTELVSEWSFREDKCWLELQPKKGFDMGTHELDLGDHLELEVWSVLTELGEMMVGESLWFLPEHLWDISVQFTNPSLFDYETTVTHKWNQTVLTLHIWQRAPSTTHSEVRFQCVYCPQHCQEYTQTVSIFSGCPAKKHLSFSYPKPTHRVKLPVNYRPPSWLGTAIPISPHIYHADPSRPLMNTHYDISKMSSTGKGYPQTVPREGHQVKLVGAECNCSRDLESATDVRFSDCITKVFSHPFGSPFPLEFTMELGGGVQAAIIHPIVLEELNNRTDLTIKGQVNDRVIDPSGQVKEMLFHGPGLYHLKATVQTNSSLCQLTTQITVYVDRVPLMKVTEYSLATSTAVLLGVLIFTANWYYRHLHSC